MISTARSNVSKKDADEDKLSCFLQQTYSKTATVCVCVVVVVVASAAVVSPKKIQPVAQPRSLDEENYFRVIQHPKT